MQQLIDAFPGVNFHIISDWINHNKSDEKGSNNAKIVAC